MKWKPHRPSVGHLCRRSHRLSPSDIYVLLMLPLIARPAPRGTGPPQARKPRVRDLARPPLLDPGKWPAAFSDCWGGYFTDRFGRRRRTDVQHHLFTLFPPSPPGSQRHSNNSSSSARSPSSVVCVEFRRRGSPGLPNSSTIRNSAKTVLGTTQAFSSFGGVLVATANQLAVKMGAIAFQPSTEPTPTGRYTLMSGVIPALPLLVIRAIPAGNRRSGKAAKASGTLKRPSRRRVVRTPRTGRRRSSPHLCSPLAYGARVRRHPAASANRARPARTRQAETPASTINHRGRNSPMQGNGRPDRGAPSSPSSPIRIVSRRTLLRIFQVPGPLPLCPSCSSSRLLPASNG